MLYNFEHELLRKRRRSPLEILQCLPEITCVTRAHARLLIRSLLERKLLRMETSLDSFEYNVCDPSFSRKLRISRLFWTDIVQQDGVFSRQNFGTSYC